MIELSFETIKQRIENIRLRDSFDAVIGVGRGGIIPAALIAAKGGVPLYILYSAFRDDSNQPVSENPAVQIAVPLPHSAKRLLIVDDVSVSGKTLEAVKHSIKPRSAKTLVLLGKADYVLFPEIQECVRWPWKMETDSHA